MRLQIHTHHDFIHVVLKFLNLYFAAPPPPLKREEDVASPRQSWLLIDGAVVVIECASSAVKVGPTHHTVLCIECMFVLR